MERSININLIGCVSHGNVRWEITSEADSYTYNTYFNDAYHTSPLKVFPRS